MPLSALEREIAHHLDSLDAPRVLVIGDLILDKYVWGEADRISPEAPTPVVKLREEESRPGGAGSVAIGWVYALTAIAGVAVRPAIGAAISVGLATENRITTTVVMPYVDRLADFGLWFRQLWAESLGKNGKGTDCQ